MYLADTLSRAYLLNDGKHDDATEIESINAVQDIRITSNTLQEIKDHTEKDIVLQGLKKVIQAGWPETKTEVSHQISPYSGIRDELSVYVGIVVRGERAVVAQSLRREIDGIVSSL